MAVSFRRILHLRPRFYSNPFPLRHFSSSSDPSATPPSESAPERNSAADTRPSFSSYFKDVRDSLQKEPPPDSQNRPQSPRKPLSFTNRSPSQSTSPSRIGDLYEIQSKLAEFRDRTAPPPPPSSNQPFSFRELLNKRNVMDQASGGTSSFSPIRESLQHLGKTKAVPNHYSDTQRMKPGPVEGESISTMIKRTSNSFLGNVGNWRLESVYEDLGKKLKMSRPEKRKGKWFSLQELSDRLGKVRQEEEKKSEALMGVAFKEIRGGLLTVSKSKEEKQRRGTLQTFGILGQLGGTPNYMLFPPQEHLVEKYFHPDNMSSAEKLKLELAKVKDEFKMSESDCGSARVQVAQLTTKIKHLSGVIHKKDKHSRKGLQAMVQRRKKLLKYLRRTDWDSYCLVISKLGLRDNPDVKA